LVALLLLCLVTNSLAVLTAFMIENKETPEKIERHPYTLEPAAEEHNQMECSSD